MDSLRRELGEARTALAAQFRMIDELSGDASQPRGELYQADGFGNLDPLDEMRERHARWRERDKTFDALAAQLRHLAETVAEDPEFTTDLSPLSAAQAQREASSVTTSPSRTTSALDDGRPAGQSVLLSLAFFFSSHFAVLFLSLLLFRELKNFPKDENLGLKSFG